MANKSITQLQVATPLTGVEVLPLVQNGITKQATAQEIANLAASLGGVTDISSDITANTPLFPLYANIQSGTAPTIFTASPNYLFTPASGLLESRVYRANNGIVLNSIQINNSYTIPVGSNGLSSGPITVNATVTVSAGSSWNIVGAVSLAPWSISGTATKVFLNYNGFPVTSIDNTGDLVAAGAVTAFGTP